MFKLFSHVPDMLKMNVIDWAFVDYKLEHYNLLIINL